MWTDLGTKTKDHGCPSWEWIIEEYTLTKEVHIKAAKCFYYARSQTSPQNKTNNIEMRKQVNKILQKTSSSSRSDPCGNEREKAKAI